ncbi:hypothetical protein FQN55_004837 [Onygenales sp. PD_40]|nr:hypothetical protein FQN55_004837 [Onygenales sp. PD_40]KAK2775075.1 hypothetical protein FQN53_003330 [Emmonsiellopsis sp. PD_33]KAK2785414.1 hypothetical protein FQN52_008474 [Onygenales sp. PD_12]KAK2806135.1 hypothetical protein FQN51_008089 [Onygenales sp. PD_10]
MPFTHAPSTLIKFWLAVSLPLIAWDSGYALMRPWTMEGGFLHWPLWVPYKLYGEVDHVYGWEAFNANSGFTSAQSFLNVVESLMYIYYYWAWSSAAVSVKVAGAGGETRRVLVGRPAAVALLVGFSAAVMTLSKSVLYWLCEYFSGFENIGHNSFMNLLIIFIIPNGAWLVFPTIMCFKFGGELVDGLAASTPGKLE